MDSIPKDVQLIIYKFIWQKGINFCHKELENRKITIVRQVIEYNKGSDGMCVKKWSFGLSNILYNCNIIDYANIICDIIKGEALFSLYDYDSDELIWVEYIMFDLFEKISNTNKWIELPEPPN